MHQDCCLICYVIFLQNNFPYLEMYAFFQHIKEKSILKHLADILALEWRELLFPLVRLRWHWRARRVWHREALSNSGPGIVGRSWKLRETCVLDFLSLSSSVLRRIQWKECLRQGILVARDSGKSPPVWAFPNVGSIHINLEAYSHILWFCWGIDKMQRYLRD